MHTNDKFTWPCSTVTPRERVTGIETIVQNLYQLTNFYRLIVSTGTVGEKIIWSPADFVRLPTDKAMISL